MQLKIAIEMAAFPWITWQTVLSTQDRKGRICLEKNRPRDKCYKLGNYADNKIWKNFQNYGILK